MSYANTMDVVIMSLGKSPEHIEMTKQAILSCQESTDGSVKFRYTVLESEQENKPPPYRLSGIPIRTVYTFPPFNYNRSINIACDLLNGPRYLAVCNNDLQFGRLWATHLIETMRLTGAASASPWSPGSTYMKLFNPDEQRLIYKCSPGMDTEASYRYRPGYGIGRELAGWCFVIDRLYVPYMLEDGRLNETCDFWFSDNIYAEQLEKAGLLHVLAFDSVVRHIENRTINSLSAEEKHRVTIGMKPFYDEWQDKQQ